MSEGNQGFIKERIKDKPINKKKYMIRAGLAVLLGVLFGLVSAISYTAGVYHLENTVYQPDVRQVVIPSDDKSQEVSAPDIATGTEEKDNSSTAVTVMTVEEEKREEVPDESRVSRESHNELEQIEAEYSSMYDVAQAAAKCMLPVYAVSPDNDWFTDTYESEKRGSGLVIADNRRELLILIDRSVIADASEIRVTLPDGTSPVAKEKKYDPNIGLSIIGIELDDISESTMNDITTVDFGSSKGDTLTGKNVIAVGSPLGVSDSVSYGIVTSSSKLLQKKDADLQILTTNIYGSSNATGILVNLKGQTVGIITQDAAETGVKNLISAYGISDIKESIERMANGQDRAYLGIYGTDVTPEAMVSFSIPQGAYVTGIEADSPAMECGMQSGDVITMIGTNEIRSFSDFESAMERCQPGDETVITVERASRREYTEMTFEVKLGTLN